MLKAKRLKFSKGKPFLNYQTQKAEIRVLTMDDAGKNPAYYEVRPGMYGLYEASFWAMNRGIGIDDSCASLDEAKEACQRHYDSLIRENCE